MLNPDMIQNYYKYDSGAKEFKMLPLTKNFSIAVDAVTLDLSVLRKPTSEFNYY